MKVITELKPDPNSKITEDEKAIMQEIKAFYNTICKSQSEVTNVDIAPNSITFAIT